MSITGLRVGSHKVSNRRHVVENMLNPTTQEDGENGFELVDKPKEGVNEGPSPLPSWINPPTSLPLNLMAGPPPMVLPVGQLFPTTSTPTVANSQLFTGSSGLHQSQTVSCSIFNCKCSMC